MGTRTELWRGKKRKIEKVSLTKLNEIYWMNKIYTEAYVLYSSKMVIRTEQIQFDQTEQVEKRKRRI